MGLEEACMYFLLNVSESEARNLEAVRLFLFRNKVSFFNDFDYRGQDNRPFHASFRQYLGKTFALNRVDSSRRTQLLFPQVKGSDSICTLDISWPILIR